MCYSALFYGGIVFGERFAIDGVSAWYPAAGISLALCLWGGPIMFPLVFANEMMLCWVYVPVSFVSKTPYSLFLLGKALLYGAESAVLLCIDPSVQVNSPLKAVRFVIVVAVFHFTIGSFFFLMLFANNVSFDYGSGVASWLLGDATGVFAVTITFLEIRRAMIRIQGGTFALLTVTRFGKTFKWLYLLLRIAILVSLTTILLWLVFWPIPSDDVPRFYLVMLPLVVASLEFGVLGSALWFCVIAFSTLLTIFYSNDILPGSDIIDYQVMLPSEVRCALAVTAGGIGIGSDGAAGLRAGALLALSLILIVFHFEYLLLNVGCVAHICALLPLHGLRAGTREGIHDFVCECTIQSRRVDTGAKSNVGNGGTRH